MERIAMAPLELVGALIATGVVPALLSWLEGRLRLRKPREPEEVADQVASLAAQEAVEIAATEHEKPQARLEAPPAAERGRGGSEVLDEPRLEAAIRAQLANPEIQRQLRLPSKPGARSRAAQIVVSVGLTAYS